MERRWPGWQGATTPVPAALLPHCCVTMQVARTLLLGVVWCCLASGAAALRRGPTPAYRLFCNTRLAAVRAAVPERLLQHALAAAAAAARAAATLAHYSHSSCRSRSAFDGLDQPDWRRRLEQDVFPALRQGYSIDARLSWEVRSTAGAAGLSG